jgi:hypothetical protein
MFFRRKKWLEIDVGSLKRDEKEWLSHFLRSSLKVNVTLSGNKASVESEELPVKKLKQLVNKFIYHRNLNRKYWVELRGRVVKINGFEKKMKHEKPKREGIPPSTIPHGW